MTTAQINSAIDNLSFNLTSKLQKQFSDYQGQQLVVYFYPKDSTPGCTLEGQDFRDNIDAFDACNTTILGISRDTIASHEKFKAKQCFPFELISDRDETLCKYFDVIKDKTMFGKLVRGIQRSTFLIDKDGILRQEWRKVKVKGHVTEVLAAAQQLNGR